MADSLAELQIVLDAQTAKYQRGIERVERKLGVFEKRQKSSLLKLDRAWKTFGAAFAGYFSLRTAKGIVLQADAMTELHTRMRTATQATGDYNKVSRELLRISNENGVALRESVSLFQNLGIAARSLGKSNDDVLELTSTIQKMGTLGGASTQELNNSLRQFSQAMAGGVVRAEELNSIIENTPYIADQIADALGMTVGEMRKLGIEGKLLSEDVFDAVLSKTEKMAEDFANMPPTISRVTAKMSNLWNDFIHQANEAYSVTGSVLSKLDEFLNKLARSEEMKVADELEQQRKNLSRYMAEYEKGNALQQGWYRRLAVAAAEEIAVLEKKLEKIREIKRITSVEPITLTVDTKIGSVTSEPLVGLGENDAAKSRAKLVQLQNRLILRSTDAIMKRFEQAAEIDPFAAARSKARLTSMQFRMLDKEFQRYVDRLNTMDNIGDYAKEPRDQLLGQQDERMRQLEDAYAGEVQLREKYLKIRAELEAKHSKEIEQFDAAVNMARLNNAAALAGNMADILRTGMGEQSDVYKAMFAISKAFSIASSILAIKTGMADALKLGFPAGISAMSSVAAAGATIMSDINSVSYGGGRAGGGPVSSGVAYSVNERGPEVFIPNSSGRVMPPGRGGNVIVKNFGAQVSQRQRGDDLELTVRTVESRLAQNMSRGTGSLHHSTLRATGTRRHA